MAYQPPDI